MEADDASSTASSSESSDLEEFAADLDSFKGNVHMVYMATEQISKRLLRACERAAEEEGEAAALDTVTAAFAEPHRPIPAVEAWLAARLAPSHPTFQEFFTVCLDAAESLDLSSRTVTFRPEDAAILTGGQPSLSIYELLSVLPRCLIFVPQ